MNRVGFALLAFLLAVGRPLSVTAEGGGSVVPTPACNFAMIKGPYSFQCHGSAFTGVALEPVSFVGTVSGNGTGFFEGHGTFNSSGGSASTHFSGPSTPVSSCVGRVTYTTYEILTPVGPIPLPPVSFDYVVVLGGKELLGTGVAPPGVTGDFVPRLTCRLVRQRH